MLAENAHSGSLECSAEEEKLKKLAKKTLLSPSCGNPYSNSLHDVSRYCWMNLIFHRFYVIFFFRNN